MQSGNRTGFPHRFLQSIVAIVLLMALLGGWASASAAPSMTSPASGSVLSGSSVNFSWAANGVAVTQWWLSVGKTVGGTDYLSQDQGSATSKTLSGLPVDGRTVYVRLWYKLGGIWVSLDYTYKAASSSGGGTGTGGGSTTPALSSPTLGSVLSGASVDFSWSANGVAVTQWWLSVGKTVGGTDYLSQDQGSATSKTVSGLPVDGSTVYVRLWYKLGGIWVSLDYTYTASKEVASKLITDPFLLKCFGGSVPSDVALKTLSTFTCDGVDLSTANLSQLMQLTNLRTLDLSHTKLTEISGLAGLTRLTSLNLQFNAITSISALSDMTQLQYLNLGFNEITDISALVSLNSLQELYLDANTISTISTLSGKTTLTKLYLDDNQLSSINALSGLTNLTHLGLGYNQLGSVNALSGLSKLQVLVLDANNLSNISSLARLTALQRLYLRGNLLTDVTSLSGLTGLQILELGFNQLANAAPLSQLTNLTQLGLDFNAFTNVSALSGMTQLKSLDLEHNLLVTTNGIPNLSALNGLLRLGNNLLLDEDISSLAGMTNSYSLHLEDNCLASISLPSQIKVYGEDWQFPASVCGGTAPVAIGKTSEIYKNTATIIQLDAIDPNNDALSFKLESLSVSGGVLKTMDGSLATVGNLSGNEVQFVPNIGYLGSAGSFRFSATDSHSEKSQVVTVQIRVIDPMLADCFGAYIPSDADLQAMTSLNSCSSKNLTDISALPFYFPKLQSLFLGGNAITDYTPLQNLPNLTGLSLEGNNLDMNALEVLSGLHNMQVLELDKCQLDNADVARLSSLTKLYHLVLSDNQMTDISALSGLTGLVVLKLDKNAISDLTPLSGMYRLSNLSLSSNRIAEKQASNLTILSGKTTLSYLEIDDNALSNASALVSLANVKTLALRNNRLLTADALKSMSQSLALYVAGNCLSGTALSGWPTNITLDTAGAQRSAVNGVCPAYTP